MVSRCCTRRGTFTFNGVHWFLREPRKKTLCTHLPIAKCLLFTRAIVISGGATVFFFNIIASMFARRVLLQQSFHEHGTRIDFRKDEKVWANVKFPSTQNKPSSNVVSNWATVECASRMLPSLKERTVLSATTNVKSPNTTNQDDMQHPWKMCENFAFLFQKMYAKQAFLNELTHTVTRL